MEKMFITALKKKYRFLYRGVISVEDLWDLNLTDLDSIYAGLVETLENLPKKSLLETAPNSNTELETKIEIVKFIVAEKLEAKEKALNAQKRKEDKQKILSILNKKEEAKFENMSEEELRAKLEEL